MKKIILAGALGEKFGQEWTLDVRTPAEALRAIDANRPGFLQALIHSTDEGIAYRVLLDDRELKAEDLQFPFGRETFQVIPVIAGAGRGGWKAVAGVALAAAAIYFSGGSATGTVMGVSYGSIAMFGAAMALGGISQMLAGNPQEIVDTNPADRKPSYYFNGPVNTVTQGGPVPIGIGRLTVGSTVINGGITVDEIPCGIQHTGLGPEWMLRIIWDYYLVHGYMPDGTSPDVPPPPDGWESGDPIPPDIANLLATKG